MAVSAGIGGGGVRVGGIDTRICCMWSVVCSVTWSVTWSETIVTGMRSFYICVDVHTYIQVVCSDILCDYDALGRPMRLLDFALRLLSVENNAIAHPHASRTRSNICSSHLRSIGLLALIIAYNSIMERFLARIWQRRLRVQRRSWHRTRWRRGWRQAGRWRARDVGRRARLTAKPVLAVGARADSTGLFGVV